MDFGQRVKQLRKEHKLRQEDLAEKVSKTRSAVAGWETEGKEPDHETLTLLSNIFGVSIDYLLGKTNNKDQVIVDTKEKADDLADEIIKILLNAGEITEEEFRKGYIDVEKKDKLIKKVKKVIEFSQDIDK